MLFALAALSSMSLKSEFPRVFRLRSESTSEAAFIRDENKSLPG